MKRFLVRTAILPALNAPLVVPGGWLPEAIMGAKSQFSLAKSPQPL
jgi:hypothetical protein